MAMTYNSLVAPKGTSGSIANWVSYTLLDLPPIVDESQALISSILRCREMMTELSFSMGIGSSYIALPARFLDPIGRIQGTSFNIQFAHKDSNFVQQNRVYTETSGTLGTDPFTTTSGSDLVTVTLANHGFSQDSVFNTSGATAFNGTTLNGTFPIVGITDANNFVIDTAILGTTPSGSGSGGGTVVAYLCDNLIAGIAKWWSIWNEQIKFDQAFTQQTLCKLQYYQSLPLLSSTNQSNFLTNRYPQLMRVATTTAAADFMKDDAEYQKGMARLQAIVQRISVENDMSMRGMEIESDTP